LNDKDISVALAVGHALVQFKSNSGYDVYYSIVAGVRKGRTSLITEELNQMKTPERAIRFAFDQGIGFLPYGGYGMEALHLGSVTDARCGIKIENGRRECNQPTCFGV
jgi:hypothetical protein